MSFLLNFVLNKEIQNLKKNNLKRFYINENIFNWKRCIKTTATSATTLL